MPSRRMIDPAFWESESMADLDYFERLVFIGLFSQADDQGRLKAHPALLCSRLFPYDALPVADMTLALDHLAAIESIQPYAVDGKALIQIANWWKYQNPRFAWPSDIPAPDGWADRLHYRRGNDHVFRNWPDAEDTDAPELDTPKPIPVPEWPQSGAKVEPERESEIATPSSRDRDSGLSSGSSSSRGNDDLSPPATADKPPTPQPPENDGDGRSKKKKPDPLSDGQRGFLEPFGAIRFKTIAQQNAVLALEDEHGTEKLLEAATWAAERGMSVGKAVGSVRTALPKWGAPKIISGQTNAKDRAAEIEANIKRRMSNGE